VASSGRWGKIGSGSEAADRRRGGVAAEERMTPGSVWGFPTADSLACDGSSSTATWARGVSSRVLARCGGSSGHDGGGVREG
jgi:hypothetical protein